MLEGSILYQLDQNHRDGDRPLNLGVYYKNTLVSLCHALEDFILNARSEPLVIAAFQQGKWYLEEADRYGQLADKSRQIAILASPDAGFRDHPTGQRSNVELMDVDPSDPISAEWHLVILAPTYTAMVLCQELTDAEYGPQGPPDEDLERKFYGFWTFEPDLVLETVEIAIAHVERYDPTLAARLRTECEPIAAQLGGDHEDIGVVVSQVVDYLRDNQQALADGGGEAGSYLPHADDLDANLVSNEMQAFLRMAQLIDRADARNPSAAAEVAALTEAVAQLLDLPAWQQKRLRLASFLHRLVPTGLGIAAEYAPPEREAAPRCNLNPNVQALRAMPQMRAIARIVTHQTEHWDGSGTPGGLSHDAIPLESRVLGAVSYFQHRVNDLRTNASAGEVPSREETLAQALAECQERAGTEFDPKLVEVLEVIVLGMQQGMDLPAQEPKFAAGVWMLGAGATNPAAASTAG